MEPNNVMDSCATSQEGFLGFSEKQQQHVSESASIRQRVSPEGTTNCRSAQNGIKDDTFQKLPSVLPDNGIKRRLLHRKELPRHLQFNPYIDTGYRPLLSVWECVLSLFYLHNETVNIITHGEIF